MFKQEMVITHAMNRNWPLGIPFLITDHRDQYGWQQPRSQGILSFWYRTAAKMIHPISERQDALGTMLWWLNLKDFRNFLFDQKNGKLLTLFRMGFFGWGRGKTHVTKICHTYPAMMKLSTVYESRDIFFEFCWYQHFFTRN